MLIRIVVAVIGMLVLSQGISQKSNEIVLLVSIDGCRYDYPDLTETPNLDRIAKSGVRAQGLIPVFPSKTFPNHYSQVTGLYPEHHGIIANNMYDSTFQEEFYIGAESPARDGKWYGGEPIWVTAERQGRISATFFWPGSDAEINGVRPTHWQHYDGSIPYKDRVDQVLAWLTLPEYARPAFLTIYFESVDTEGHNHGPASPQALAALRRVDGHIGKLLDGIAEARLQNTVNIIVVSDHGMSQLSRDRVIFLDDYIDQNRGEFLSWSPIAHIIPPPGHEQAWYDTLHKAHYRMNVYLKGQVPEELHYNNHRRITPLIAVADEGWSITTRTHFFRRKDAFTGGTHGYTPGNREMHGIFLASGPSIARDVKVPSLECIHLYELMCHILRLNPAPNDGDIEVVREILR